MVLRTSNDRVEGEFRALGEGGISVESQQGKVEGNFFAPKGVRVESRNAPIKAEVEVGKGAEVLLRTTGFKVDASVKIVDQAAHIEPSEHPDSQPPTYAPAPSLGAGSGRVSILAETTEAAVALVTESDSAVVLSTEVRTNGGGKVEVQHRGEEGWRGSFSVRVCFFCHSLAR